MTSLDFLYIALGVGFLILVGFLSYTLYQFSLTIKSMKYVIENVEDITDEVRSAKNSLKFGILNVLTWFINNKSKKA